MRQFKLWTCAALLMGLIGGRSAVAAIGASATITGEQALPGGGYEYSLSLKNTGDVNISTFWFGWIAYAGTIPYDFLPSLPTKVTSPSGWSGAGLNDGPGFYSIEWYTGTPLTQNQTQSGFVFDSPDAPATINGTSFFLGYPVRESWVYQNIYAGLTTQGQALNGANLEITPTISVPEPTLALLVPTTLILFRRRRA